MIVANILAWIIVAIIGLFVAPFMTIGFIFFNAGWDKTGQLLGSLFCLAGLFNMFRKILK